MPDWRYWLSLPWLLPQGLWARNRAPRLPAAAGPTSGEIAGRGEALGLLLIGDSIIAGVGVEQLQDALPGQLARALAEHSGRPVRWLAMGEGGLVASAIAERYLPQMTQVAMDRVDLVIVSAGVNDVSGMTPRSRWRTALQALHQSLRPLVDRSASHAGEQSGCIVHLGVPPLGHFPALPQPLRALFGHRARVLDQIAAEVAAQYPTSAHLPSDFVPGAEQFASDGYHPNAQACQLWARGIVEQLALRDVRWPQEGAQGTVG